MSGANPLARTFPTQVRINGRECPIRWRFTDCIAIILAYEDEGLTWQEQQHILLSRFYPELPADVGKALELAFRFLDGGERSQETDDEPEEDTPLRLYSFSRDGGLIYSAFRYQYGIDLQQDELHWWAFLALFQDLSADSRFYQLLRLRQGYLEGTLSREETALFESMGPSALPPEQPGDREREAAARRFLMELEGGGSVGR